MNADLPEGRFQKMPSKNTVVTGGENVGDQLVDASNIVV